MPALVGYNARAGALLGASTLEEAMDLLIERQWSYCEARGTSFEELMRENVRELAA